MSERLGIREMREHEAHLVVDYFLSAPPHFLKSMGINPSKLPSRELWINRIQEDLVRPLDDRELYYVLWLIDVEPIGHSNLNGILLDKEAFMHLHLWDSNRRLKGLGSTLLRMSIEHYFRMFNLQKLYCEPFAENDAPNRILRRLGFEFEKQYEPEPGWIHFRQKINRYSVTRAVVEAWR